MKKGSIWGLVALLLLGLAACGGPANRQPKGSKVAFGQTGQSSKAQVWYGAQGSGKPKPNLRLTSITITQRGQATSFPVSNSLTLGAAAKLSVPQLKKKGLSLAKQDFTQKRQALIAATNRELSVEKRNLKRDQAATVVSFAAIKTDRRIIAGYQNRLARLKRTKFQQPRPRPFSVTVEKTNRQVKQETLRVAAYAFEESADRSVDYQKTRRQIFAVPFTRVSSEPVKIGANYFGYYYDTGVGKTVYALTKVDGQRANVKFDRTSIK